jgi:hypothetical protein
MEKIKGFDINVLPNMRDLIQSFHDGKELPYAVCENNFYIYADGNFLWKIKYPKFILLAIRTKNGKVIQDIDATASNPTPTAFINFGMFFYLVHNKLIEVDETTPLSDKTNRIVKHIKETFSPAFKNEVKDIIEHYDIYLKFLANLKYVDRMRFYRGIFPIDDIISFDMLTDSRETLILKYKNKYLNYFHGLFVERQNLIGDNYEAFAAIVITDKPMNKPIIKDTDANAFVEKIRNNINVFVLSEERGFNPICPYSSARYLKNDYGLYYGTLDNIKQFPVVCYWYHKHEQAIPPIIPTIDKITKQNDVSLKPTVEELEIKKETGITLVYGDFCSLDSYNEYMQEGWSMFNRINKKLALPSISVEIQEKRKDDLGVIYKIITYRPTVVWLLGKDYLGNVWASRVPNSYQSRTLEEARRWVLRLGKKDKIVKEV